MIDQPTIDELLKEVLLFCRRGESYLREFRGNGVYAFLLELHKRGLDAQKPLRTVLPEIQSTLNLIHDRQRVWIGLVFKSLFVLASALIVRCTILALSNGLPQVDMESMDRLFMMVSSLCMVTGSLWLRHRYVHFGWSRLSQGAFWSAFKDYLTMGKFSLFSPVIGPALREILRDELRSGIDASGARENLLLGRLVSFRMNLEKEASKLGVLAVCVELATYVFSYLGFTVIPFLSWLESVYGIN